MKSKENFQIYVDYETNLQKIMSVDRYDLPKTFDVVRVADTGKRVEEKNINIKLIYFSVATTTNYVITQLYEMGLRPGNFFELISFGKIKSEIVKKFPIVALGSMWNKENGIQLVPCLDSRVVNNRIYLPHTDGNWLRECRFLAVESFY